MVIKMTVPTAGREVLENVLPTEIYDRFMNSKDMPMSGKIIASLETLISAEGDGLIKPSFQKGSDTETLYKYMKGDKSTVDNLEDIEIKAYVNKEYKSLDDNGKKAKIAEIKDALKKLEKVHQTFKFAIKNEYAMKIKNVNEIKQEVKSLLLNEDYYKKYLDRFQSAYGELARIYQS